MPCRVKVKCHIEEYIIGRKDVFASAVPVTPVRSQVSQGFAGHIRLTRFRPVVTPQASPTSENSAR